MKTLIRFVKKEGPHGEANYRFDKFDDMLVESFVLRRLISINGSTYRLVEPVALVGHAEADLMILVERVAPSSPESAIAVPR